MNPPHAAKPEAAVPDSEPAGLLDQRTIAGGVEASGVGVHSGRPATLRLEPGPVDSGIVFVRSDLKGQPEIPARLENVRADALIRMTVLESNAGAANGEPARVGMIEHLLAACAGMGIANLRALLDGPECPIFDGSALRYVEMIEEAGIESQGRAVAPLRLSEPREPVALVKDRAEIVALPAERMRLTFFAELAHAGIADQQVSFEPGRGDFKTEIAPARTWCFEQDVQKMREAGLIQGGTLDSAIVLRDGKPIEGGYRLQNELARHKLLDLMGDLALLGRPVAALISARASGHALHYEFACKLKEALAP